MWFFVTMWLQEQTNNTRAQKAIRLHAQTMITILSPIVQILKETYVTIY